MSTRFARALSMPMYVRREAAVGQGVTVKAEARIDLGRTTEGSRSMTVSSPVAVTAEGKWNVTWWIGCS